MNILITGINGFIGTNFVQKFGNIFSLYGLDIMRKDTSGIIETFLWSEINSEIISNMDVIIHLAGKAHDFKNNTNPNEYFHVNTYLTQKIFDFFLESSARKFIFFSSVKAVADVLEGEILTEEIIPNPIGPYGESKIKAEEYILSKLSDNKQVYILRPCMIHGPGNKGNLNLLYKIVSKGFPWPLGSFENKRSFTSIDNLCYIMDKLITEPIPPGIYNISDDEPCSTNELISILCVALGKKIRIWRLNKSFMTYCAKIGTILHLPLNMERLNKLTENYVVSNEKIKKVLNIDSLPVNAKEGLSKTICSFEK